jgi:hypothetical protein
MKHAQKYQANSKSDVTESSTKNPNKKSPCLTNVKLATH